MRTSFNDHGEDAVLNKIPPHVRLKDKDDQKVDMKSKEDILSGIHAGMLPHHFNAISNVLKKLEPKRAKVNKYAGMGGPKGRD